MKQKLVWFVWGLLMAVQAATVNAQEVCPPALKPAVQEAKAARLAAELLTRYHYKPTPLDNSLSSRMFDQYLKALDPEKLYFLQSDIDRLAAARTRLDDAIYTEDLRAPFEIFNLYACRATERMVHARSLLRQGFDFQGDETMLIDRKDQAQPSTEAQLKDLWRKRVKNDWLRLKLAGTDDGTIARILDKRYDNAIKRLAKITSADAFQAFMNAYTMAIEPHTNYRGPRAAEDFDISMRLSLVGIGAVLMDVDGYATIRELVPGGPASRSGKLQPGDRIVGVAQGADGPMEDVVGARLDDTVSLIRGTANSTVRLDVLPAGSGVDMPNKHVVLVRNVITMQDRAAKAKIYEVPDGATQRRVGVISLPSFYEDFEGRQKGDKNFRSASRDVAALIAEMKQQKVDSLLVDLRNNGGGSLREAVELTGLFVGKVPVVQARNAQGAVTVEKHVGGGIAWQGPLGVLINRASASASEIFAGAIQDYGRGVVIGEPSFGKGTVQTVASLDQLARNAKPAFGELQMTIAQFFRVDGGTNQLRGVTPDISFPGTMDPDEYGESSFDNALPWTRIAAADYAPVGEVKSLLPVLQSRHENRIQRDKDFQNLLQDVARVREMRKNNVISLNEATRRKEREQAEKRMASLQGAARAALADDGLQANERSLSKDLAAEKSRDAIKDVLLDEAVSIMSDAAVLKQGGKPRLAANTPSPSKGPVVVMELPAGTAGR
ncbi:MAG: carboxy terminal-processing peptidase [Rhodoferax sp.]|nr:carboxy terminal-processing peptidase [Rhodoferax sp.]